MPSLKFPKSLRADSIVTYGVTSCGRAEAKDVYHNQRSEFDVSDAVKDKDPNTEKVQKNAIYKD